MLRAEAELLQHQCPAQQPLGSDMVAARFGLFSSTYECADVVGSLHCVRPL